MIYKKIVRLVNYVAIQSHVSTRFIVLQGLLRLATKEAK